MLLDQLRNQKETIAALSRRYCARRVRAFGSVARGEERPDSDVDLVPKHELNRHLRERILPEAVAL